MRLAIATGFVMLIFIAAAVAQWPLIQQAYIANANGRIDQRAVLRTPIEGGPDWISSELLHHGPVPG